jgi:hypothetical protein
MGAKLGKNGEVDKWNENKNKNVYLGTLCFFR